MLQLLNFFLQERVCEQILLYLYSLFVWQFQICGKRRRGKDVASSIFIGCEVYIALWGSFNGRCSIQNFHLCLSFGRKTSLLIFLVYLFLRFRGTNFQSRPLYDCVFTYVKTLHWLWIQIESTTISIFLGKIQDQRHMWSQLSTCPLSAVHMSYGANNWYIYNSILNLDLVVFFNR